MDMELHHRPEKLTTFLLHELKVHWTAACYQLSNTSPELAMQPPLLTS